MRRKKGNPENNEKKNGEPIQTLKGAAIDYTIFKIAKIIVINIADRERSSKNW